MKIKFNSDNDLSLRKPLKFDAVVMVFRSVFEEGGKLYPQVSLDDPSMNYKNAAVRNN